MTVDVTAAEDGKTWVAAVPDEMLQKPGDLICYAVQSTATGTITAAYRSFRVNRRPKPAGYVALADCVPDGFEDATYFAEV